MSIKEITYYQYSGTENTDSVLTLAKKRSDDLEIDTMILASIRGYTAEKALSILQGKKLIIIGTDRGRFSPETLHKCNDKGFPVIFSHETDYHYSAEMKTAFRRFGQGMKVVVEDVVIACLQGVLKTGIDVISIAGSSRGADTAIIINTSSNFSTVKIKEIICMPS